MIFGAVSRSARSPLASNTTAFTHQAVIARREPLMTLRVRWLIHDWGDGSLKDRNGESATNASDKRKREPKMKLKIGSLALTIMAIALATAIGAQAQKSVAPPDVTSQGAPASDLPMADYQAFDNFAIAHPDLVSDLSHHPQMIENQAYLDKHPELRDFLATHAELRAALIADPGNFIEPHSGHRPR